MSEKFIMKVGESLVAGGPAGTAAEPEIVIGDLNGPFGTAFANLIGKHSLTLRWDVVHSTTTGPPHLHQSGRFGKVPASLRYYLHHFTDISSSSRRRGQEEDQGVESRVVGRRRRRRRRRRLVR